MLKNSARNWVLTRSPKCQFLAIEKSSVRNPESRKMLRPMVPRGPKAGGTSTELLFAKQSNAANDAAPAAPASVMQGDGMLGSTPAKNGIGAGPAVKSEC